MIELVSDARCTHCDICVYVCPMNVFEARAGAAPAIARQADCQTCFMCELYCPTDALYVAPDAEAPATDAVLALGEANFFGSYRKAIGWSKDSPDRRGVDASFKLLERAGH
jgi:NAD-dependent dihydropyrimidine dehydrogenase PreA subunit